MKLLFLAEAVSLAHVGRPLTLANWAFQNGHEVHFASSAESLTKIGTADFLFPTYTLNTINSALFYGRIKLAKFFYTFNEMVEYVEEEKKLITKINPDLIITDFRLTAPISTTLCNKPLLTLSNSHWSPNAVCDFPAPKTGIFNWLPSYICKKLFNYLRPIAFKTYGKELNKIRKLYGLPEKNDFRELYTDGTHTAYLDMPDFTKLEKIPKNHFFLGPVIWSPTIKNQAITLENKNNIYISMGSTGNNSLLDPIIVAALKTNASFIFSGISSDEEKKLLLKHPDLKNRSIIKALMDPETILPNCSLTICHGGSGTVYQSLSHGVPVLCFPDNPDQHLVSYAIKRQNLGQWISQKKPSVKKIYQSITECLTNPLLKNNATTYSKAIKTQNTNQQWNQFLNSMSLKLLKQKTLNNRNSSMSQNTRPTGLSVAFNQAMNATNKQEANKGTKNLGFTIKIANTLEEREAAYRLAYNVYLEKGFIHKNPNEWMIQPYDSNNETITLIVQDSNKTIAGSITLVFDGANKIPADKIYKEELKPIRDAKHKIAEISRLVISPDYRNEKEVLVLLINYLFIYIHHVKEYDYLAIQVNPRHKNYYISLLCFDEIGGEKPCPQVQNAPAILLSIPTSRYQSEVKRCNAPQNSAKKVRTLYQYFVKLEQENLVAHYLEKQAKPMSKEEKVYFGFTDTEIRQTVAV